MTERLYVVSGLNPEELPEVIRERKTTDIYIQLYAAINGEPFEPVWVEPVKCQLKPSNFGNDKVLWSEDCGLINLTGKVADTEATLVILEMADFGGADELRNLTVNIFYDCWREVGLVIDGCRDDGRLAILRVGLDAATKHYDLVSQEEMERRGLPEELWQSRSLLREMSCLA